MSKIGTAPPAKITLSEIQEWVDESIERDCGSDTPEWCIRTGKCVCEKKRRLLAEINAARELLDAAKAVLNGGFEREDSEYADALFESLAQAIAKAEGRT